MTLHPAAIWADEIEFNKNQVDCTTAIMLKILDGKCKMNAREQNALIAIYDVIKCRPGERFDSQVHKIIENARPMPDHSLVEIIHELRVHAESVIPKPVMKTFKQMMRQGLANCMQSQVV